ncbi:MAG TPA: flagellar basal body P-ring formation chaperone FlgA [Bacteroidota bacterium]|nr:flagellar basal body P-ring formation chaperone FlgA [Bacteroidota bacterium]
MFLLIGFAFSQSSVDNTKLVQRMVQQYLTQKAKDAGADSAIVAIRVLPDSKFLNQEGASIQLVEDGTLSPRGTCSVPFELVRSDKTISHFFVSTRVRTFGGVLLVTRQLPCGAPIEARDCELRWMETTTLPLDAVTQIADVEAMQTTRIVNAGMVLTRSVLRRIPVVKVEELVTLIVHSGNVALSARAIAKDEGAVDEIILVQRLGTHDRVKARILNAKTVEMVTEF